MPTRCYYRLYECDGASALVVVARRLWGLGRMVKQAHTALVASAFVLFVCLSNIAHATDEEYKPEEIEAHIRQVFALYINNPDSTLYRYNLKTLQFGIIAPDANNLDLMATLVPGIYFPSELFGIPIVPTPDGITQNAIIIAISRDFNRALAHGLVKPIFNRSPAQDRRQMWEEAKEAVLMGRRRQFFEWLSANLGEKRGIFGGAVVSEIGYFDSSLSQPHKSQHATRLIARALIPYSASSQVYPDSVFADVALKKPRESTLLDIDWALLRAFYDDNLEASSKFSDALPRIIAGTKKQLQIRKYERTEEKRKYVKIPKIAIRLYQE